MGQGQDLDHEAVSLTLDRRLEGSPIGVSRKELVAVDQAQKRHGLLAQGMDHVPVVDDVTVLAVRARPPAGQRHPRRRAEEEVETAS